MHYAIKFIKTKLLTTDLLIDPCKPGAEQRDQQFIPENLHKLLQRERKMAVTSQPSQYAPSDFQTGLCDVCDDCGTCLFGLWCFPCLCCSVASDMDECCMCGTTMAIRSVYRTRYNIQGSFLPAEERYQPKKGTGDLLSCRKLQVQKLGPGSPSSGFTASEDRIMLLDQTNELNGSWDEGVIGIHERRASGDPTGLQHSRRRAAHRRPRCTPPPEQQMTS
ncbi:hypothetical protein COCON_G00169150 [Conger conger]|uniref:Uncharacterized protein n=1 Tax=Conger conger TaxID=82655 RepID=A0A9Q1D7I9_CONCO|nr:hypothetical protein COCON_G00169150 [Conger conger]